MLGSAIPRRWIFSLALVGLVSIFAVSYAAVWSSPANADSQGPGTGTGNGNPLTPGQTLDGGFVTNGLTLRPGQQVSVEFTPIDMTGAPNTSLPNLSFNWQILSGSGVTLVGSTTGPTVILQGSAAGTTVIEGQATQVQESQDFIVRRNMTVTVVAPGPTPTPVTPPANPGTPPASIPNSSGVVTPEGTLLVSSTGLETGSGPQGQSLKDRPVVFIQKGSVSNFFGVQVSSVSPTTLPAVPSRFKIGSSAADITFYDAAGVAQNNFRLLRSAQVCLPTSSSDRVNGTSNVRLLRYNSAVGQWVELTSSYNNITQQVCGNSSNFSNFAVGVLQVQATPAPGGGLPATGGWSPGTGLLLFAGILGMFLVGGGAVSMRRAKNARPE